MHHANTDRFPFKESSDETGRVPVFFRFRPKRHAVLFTLPLRSIGVGCLQGTLFLFTPPACFFRRNLGKLTLDIKVVAADGAPLTFGKALLRSAVFCIPYFLNNARLGDGSANFVLYAIPALLVIGLGGAIVYLCLFNRRTRQSVHDLLVNAAVVRARTANAPVLQPVWKGHLAMIGAISAVTIGVIAYGHSAVETGALRPLVRVQQQVIQLPGVRSAGVFQGTTFSTGGKRMNVLSVNAVTRLNPIDDWALARHIADTTLAAYPAAQQLDTFSVTLMRGYDIGIAASWNARTFNAPPGAWRDGRVEHD